MTRLEWAVSRLDADLRALGSRWCLVGGLAVSARAEPRTARDVDVMIVVDLLFGSSGIEGRRPT